ncbi:unnamed protein product [Hymenolepis diminuta]|uniref:DUF5727 domain-containing protein n=1 Tax=Hymenolepis diminuta TaxID=6216 RepID=A0A564Y624_HYMDI|nr:unnamed protein product [Hymenolepis diminuta]
MIQLVIIFMCCFSSAFAQSGEVVGSRVITTSSGKVGPMYFNLTNVPEILVYKKDSYLFYLTIENGSCIVYGKIVGSPCAVQAGKCIKELFYVTFLFDLRLITIC